MKKEFNVYLSNTNTFGASILYVDIFGVIRFEEFQIGIISKVDVVNPYKYYMYFFDNEWNLRWYKNL